MNLEIVKNSKILIVDDEPSNLGVLLDGLRDLECTIMLAQNGESALEIAKEEQPDLILLDILMPGMDGFEVCRRLKENNGDMDSSIIIFITALSDASDKVRGFELGAVDFITKPFQREDVIARVSTHLGIRKLQKDLQENNERLQQEIANRRQADEELCAGKKQAESANQAKTRFLANLTHDIRTPLGAIMGFNQLLLEKYKNQDLTADPDTLKYHENIQVSAQMLLEMINNFLDISKIEAGKMGLSEEDFSIQEMVENIYDTHKMVARNKGIILTCNVSPELPAFLRSDRTKLIQILTNLIGNAIKFTPEGREVRLRVMGDQKTMVFMVTDQGIGIPKDRCQAIFDDFEQADDSTSRNYGGTGLGLAITKKLTELLGGKISVVSQGVDQGSNFSVRIPFKEASGPVVDQEDVSPGEDKFSKESIILVVEDNMMNQFLIRALLEKFGLKALFAENGKQGVDKTLELVAKGSPPDLIFMDIQMPVMDGVEATRQIRQNPDCQEIPIVGLSADAFIQQQEKALGTGMNKYLTKPVDPVKLRGVLDKYLKKMEENSRPPNSRPPK